MINIITVHPNIFDLESFSLSKKDEYLKSLQFWCHFCISPNDITVFDKNNIIKTELLNYMKKEPSLENRKKLESILKFLENNSIKSKISAPQLKIFNSDCDNILRLTQKVQPDKIFLREINCNNKCLNCFQTVSDLVLLQNTEDIINWEKTEQNFSQLPGTYTFKEIIEYLKFDKIVNKCKYFQLYDKNIIPEKSSGISANYIFNLELFLSYFKNTNINPQIITYVTSSQNKTSIQNTQVAINNISKKINVKIDLKILSCRDINGEYRDKIHNRYIMTDIVNCSIDKGLDLINKTNKFNYSFDINIISPEKIDKYRNYLSQLAPYRI